MAAEKKLANNRAISPIREEDTQQSDISTKRGAYSHTYSATDRVDLNGTVHSYSEIYESATRESIDETHEDLRERIPPTKATKPNKTTTTNTTTKKQSITWTHKYTTEEIEKRKNKIGWDELVNLEQLYSLQMINTVEYKMRKRKLIDSMTGTKVNIETENKFSKIIDESKEPPQRRVLGETEIIKKIVNFNKIICERAIRHSCHIKIIYNEETGQQLETKEEWSQDMRIIKMAKNPFNNGTLRYVYYMQDTTDIQKQNDNMDNIMNNDDEAVPIKQNTATHVAKISIDPMEEYETYFHDVAMQKHAQRFADEFNKNEVPKKVGFLDCWVYELVDRTPHIFCGVEKFIHGDYHKYTNNWDWVNQAVDRNTPSAFSHFTYQASKYKILICDLQGVGDLYTDPQMHTYNGKGCGKGNMGKRGIEKFLSSHKCNAICTYLKLPHTNLSSQFTGTLPQKRYMNNEHIDQVPVTNGQYTVPDTTQCNTYNYGSTATKTHTTTTTTTNTMNQQLLGPNKNQYLNSSGSELDDDDDENDGYPFGRILPDNNDHEDSKCWCIIL